jgi:hypothetical protein
LNGFPFTPFTAPFTALVAGTEASSAFFGTWAQFWENRLAQQEAVLQKDLIEGATDEEANPERIPIRITRVTAAARTFLDRNRLLTLFSISDLTIRQIELQMLRRFVYGAQLAEHAARQQIVPHVPLKDWEAAGSWREELAKLAEKPDVYQVVNMMPLLPQGAKEPAVRQLCCELIDEHRKHHPQQQIG